LVRALRARVLGDDHVAAQRFEAAIDGALRHQRAMHHALGCELAAQFHAAQGSARAATAYREAAVQAYRVWGAAAIVGRLRGHAGADAKTSVARAAAVGLDVEIVAQASQVLSQERDPASLLRVLFDLVRQYAAAERGVLLWEVNGRWIARAGFGVERVWLEPEAAVEADDTRVPASVFHYITQSLQPLLLQDAALHPRFGLDPQVRESGVRSIVGLPIRHRGQTVGALYLENRQAPTTLETGQLETLQLLGLQFAIAYENASVFRNLEALVDARTLELQSARHAAEAATRAKSEFLANMSH
ncbi:MAG: GAF domain-containing protein, partial [Rhizobacter sp.]